MLASVATKTREQKAALKFFKKSMSKNGRPDALVTGNAPAPRMRALQKFASVPASACNHFNQERDLPSRDKLEANRSAALSESRGPCAA